MRLISSNIEREKKMKKFLIALAIVFYMPVMVGTVSASLVTIGNVTTNMDGGTVMSYNLIWDNDNNGNSVVWFDYVTDWEYAGVNLEAWASGINNHVASSAYNFFDDYIVTWDEADWRLPSAGMNPQLGFNQTSSELGHLYYDELGLDIGTPEYPTTDAELNATNFDNLTTAWLWTSTEHTEYADSHYIFSTYNGQQDFDYWNDSFQVHSGIAIRNATVISPVPIPAAAWLFGSALISLFGFAKRKKV